MNRAVEYIMRRDSVDSEYATKLVREAADELVECPNEALHILHTYLGLDETYLVDVISA